MLINSMSIGMKVGKGAGLTLTQQAINILRIDGYTVLVDGYTITFS